MALITCPECGKEISDKAATCPGCGAPITGSQPVMQDADTVEFKPTPVGGAEKKPTKGIALIVGGIALMLIGLPMLSILIGIAPIVLGIILVLGGFVQFKKSSPCKCPYCLKDSIIPEGSNSFKCPYCKKTSVLRNGMLYPAGK